MTEGPRLTLLIGGARSGKSALAERLARATSRPVVLLATMEPHDAEVRHRIAAHRAARAVDWRTIEEPVAVIETLRQHVDDGETIILDCMTMWVSNLIMRLLPATPAAVENQDHAIASAIDAASGLVDWAVSREGEVVVVTNEVGSGVVPSYQLGRVFRDALGRANAVVAARADRVYHLTAGLAIELKSLGARPVDE
jgi:adenosylcobinamide kinase/adenosylcobinamide-phosphate guanylyltransferase